MKTTLKLAMLLLLAAPAYADSVVQFQFNQNLGLLGNVDTFNIATLSLPINGYSAPGIRAALWMKNDAPDEIGIGLAREKDHEISGTQFVQVDLSKIFAVHPVAVTLTMNSIQAGETYDIWGSNVAGVLGTELAANASTPDFTVPSNFDLISVTSGSTGNVLLNDVTAHFVPTPEPSTLVLLATGLVVLACIRGKRTSGNTTRISV